jgi:ribosomal protein S18 acetylase RimI-like enzyme
LPQELLMQPVSAELTSRPLLEFTGAQACEAMNRSFVEYFVPLVFDAASFERRFRGESLDAQASKLWFLKGKLVGLVLIARRGWTSRVAAMGLVKEARGKGYGKLMLTEAIAEATARDDRRMLLEVFTPNEPARRLYERLGFQNTRLLTSFNCPGKPGERPTQELAEADPREVARLLSREADEDLPWMMAPETLMAAAPPVRAYQLAGKAFAIVRVDSQRTVLLTLVVPKIWRRQGWGSRLLRSLASTADTQPFTAPMVLEGPGYAFLQSEGWVPQPLTLFEMQRPLGAQVRAAEG